MPQSKPRMIRVRVTHGTYVRFYRAYYDLKATKKYKTLEDFLTDLLQYAEGGVVSVAAALR